MNYNGVLTDDRSEELKGKDYNINSPEFATAFALNWTEKDPTQWKKYSVRNQNGSGSCVAQAFSKALEIIYALNEKDAQKFYEVYSATPIFKRRQNFGTTGMYLYDAADITKKLGTTLESLCPSQNMNDAQIDASNIPETPTKISGYIYTNNKDFYGIAGMIEQYGHCILTFNSNYEEWTSIPEFKNTPVKWGHCVCATDYVLYKGKEYIVVDESWGHGATEFDAKRLISKEFLTARCTGAVSLLPVKKVELPKYVFQNKLIYGIKNNDVLMLQKALQILGFFPSGVTTTGYYGNVTVEAVKKFQLAYKDEILTPSGLTNPTGIFGNASIKKLNEILNSKNSVNMNTEKNTEVATVVVTPSKKWYLSKTLWVGVLTALAGGIVAFKDTVPNPEVVGALTMALGAVQIALRLITSTSINY